MDTIVLLADIEELKKQNEQLSQDAKRYRWLRDKSGDARIGIYKDAARGKEWVNGENADDLVDFAMQKT